MKILEYSKQKIEKLFDIKIYRNSLPFGTNLFLDIKRYFNINEFSVIFDVGANIGQTAMYYASNFLEAKIYSFEPITSTFLELKKNTKNYTNIYSFNIAFGDSTEQLPMHISEDSKVNSFISNIKNLKETAKIQTVDVKELDNFLYEHKIKKIDFLKIDAEGFDLKVLKGASFALQSDIIDFIQVEVGFDPTTIHVGFNQIMDYLLINGYKLFGLYDQQPYWDGHPWIMFANAVFIRSKIWKKHH